MISHIKEKIWFYKTICLNTNMQIYSFFGKITNFVGKI